MHGHSHHESCAYVDRLVHIQDVQFDVSRRFQCVNRSSDVNVCVMVVSYSVYFSRKKGQNSSKAKFHVSLPFVRFDISIINIVNIM